MKRLILLSCLALLAGCPAPPPSTAADAALERATQVQSTMPVDSQALTDTLARAGRPSTEGSKVDSSTFPYPVLAGIKTADGYPVYLLRCAGNVCIDTAGRDLGSRAEVAVRITPIRNSDVRNPQYHCDWVCTDAQGHVVGAIAPQMRAYLKLPPTP